MCQKKSMTLPAKPQKFHKNQPIPQRSSPAWSLDQKPFLSCAKVMIALNIPESLATQKAITAVTISIIIIMALLLCPSVCQPRRMSVWRLDEKSSMICPCPGPNFFFIKYSTLKFCLVFFRTSRRPNFYCEYHLYGKYACDNH